MVYLTLNFTEKELQCPCCSACKMDKTFLFKLQKLREALGKPLRVSSGYRCKTHNEKVGGVSNSKHLLGKAADIIISTSPVRYMVLREAIKLGFSGIGVYSNFIHLDTRDERACVWVG